MNHILNTRNKKEKEIRKERRKEKKNIHYYWAVNSLKEGEEEGRKNPNTQTAVTNRQEEKAVRRQLLVWAAPEELPESPRCCEQFPAAWWTPGSGCTVALPSSAASSWPPEDLASQPSSIGHRWCPGVQRAAQTAKGPWRLLSLLSWWRPGPSWTPWDPSPAEPCAGTPARE